MQKLISKVRLSKVSIVLGVVIFSVFWLFSGAMANLWRRWGESEELSHGYFIPLVSLWLVWNNREAIRQSVGAPALIGLGALLAALLLALLGKLINFYFVEHLGLWVAIGGIVTLYGGLSLLRILAAPLAFLAFAIPPPYWVMTELSWQFQEISSILGVLILRGLDVPVFLSGNIIDLGVYKLQVAEACSGLRYLFPFLSLGVIVAYLYQGPLWQKLLIVATVPPITILMNSFRIALTGIFVNAYGLSHAEGFLHFFEGWVVFLLCLILLLGVVFALNYAARRGRSIFDALSPPNLQPVTPSTPTQSSSVLLPFAAASVALALIASHTLMNDAFIKPPRRNFAELPYEFSGWRYDIQPISQAVQEALAADDAIIFNLTSPAGAHYNLYLAYLENRRDGSAWHSPRQCIPGGGWRITKHDILKTETHTGEGFAYNRLIIENQDKRQLVYYWYDQRGRKMANEFVMRFWTVWDSVFRRRPDGALVRLITPVEQGETLGVADERLQKMGRKMHEFLPEYVPD